MIKAEQATGKIRYAMKAKATSAPVIQFGQRRRRADVLHEAQRRVPTRGASADPVFRAYYNEPQTKWNSEAQEGRATSTPKTQAKSKYKREARRSQDANNGFSGGAPASCGGGHAFDNAAWQSVSSMQGFQGSRVRLPQRQERQHDGRRGDCDRQRDRRDGCGRYKLAGDKEGGRRPLGTAPLAAGTNVLFGTLDGKIERLDYALRQVDRLSYAVGSSGAPPQPVVDGGWINVGTEDGKLVAIDTKDKRDHGLADLGRQRAAHGATVIAALRVDVFEREDALDNLHVVELPVEVIEGAS